MIGMNTQTKFLQRVQDEADVRGFIMVNNKTYANTGTIRFERTDSFVPVLSFGYDFQQGYARFHGDLGDPSRRSGFVGSRTVKFDDLDSVLETLRGLLKPERGRKA